VQARPVEQRLALGEIDRDVGRDSLDVDTRLRTIRRRGRLRSAGRQAVALVRQAFLLRGTGCQEDDAQCEEQIWTHGTPMLGSSRIQNDVTSDQYRTFGCSHSPAQAVPSSYESYFIKTMKRIR
jgi:hypothetical protein